MEAALKNYDENWTDSGKNEVSPRVDATFTEIYELIFHNKTMVRSEWSVLLQLIEKKCKEQIVTPRFKSGGENRSISLRQTSAG